MKTIIYGDDAMRRLGERIGAVLRGGEVIELIGDVGAGKTTLTKGIAQGLEIDNEVQSPSFTISRTYDARDGLQLAHYDFYRLDDAGILANEIADSVHDGTTVTVIEWASIVAGVLPEDHIQIVITTPTDDQREVEIKGIKI